MNYVQHSTLPFLEESEVSHKYPRKSPFENTIRTGLNIIVNPHLKEKVAKTTKSNLKIK